MSYLDTLKRLEKSETPAAVNARPVYWEAAKFSAEMPKSLPDIPDIVPSVSALSVSDLEGLAKTIHPQPGDRITWEGGDGSTQTGVIDDLHTDQTGAVWAFISLPGGLWTAINLKFADSNRSRQSKAEE